jgi:hypothetical protein
VGVLTDKAFETDALILNDTVGVFSGSSTPEVDAPDAPQGSVYYRSNGDRYTRTADTGSGVATDWVREDPDAVSGGSSLQATWKFSTSTTEANPGSGRLRYDNATPASVTKLFINDTTNAGFDISNIFNNILAIGDQMYLQQADNGANFLIVTITGITDNTGWFTLDVTVDDSGSLPQNNRDLGTIIFTAGGGGGGAPSDQAGVQARRTTVLAFTDAWVDVTLDTTDSENDDAVVDHDDTLRDRLVFKETGPYWVTYRVDTDQPAPITQWQTLAQARVTLNDVDAAVNGSDSSEQALEDGSLVGDAAVWPSLQAGFIFNATANDFLTLQIQKTDSDTGTNLQAAAGRVVFTATRQTGATGAQGTPGSGGSTIRVGKTYAIAGEIKVPVGQTDFLVPFFVSLAGGQTADLVKVRHQIQAGTSVTCKLQKNGVDITGFTAISVTTTAASVDPTDVALAEDDEIALIVTAVAGTPQNMTFTIFIEHTG